MGDVAVSSRFAQAKWLWAEIAQLRECWDIRRHPFAERWSEGELTDTDLQLYAGENHHAVVALASASRRAAALADGMLAEALSRYADDRKRRIGLWCEFAAAAGWCRTSSWYYAQDPLPPTVACVRAWSGGRDRSLAEHLVTVYAAESARCQVVGQALDALVHRCRFDERATRYFRPLAERGVGDAGLAEAALTSLLPADNPLALLRQAELTYCSYWGLLDGVQDCL